MEIIMGPKMEGVRVKCEVLCVLVHRNLSLNVTIVRVVLIVLESFLEDQVLTDDLERIVSDKDLRERP
jgi:hypothetical protein